MDQRMPLLVSPEDKKKKTSAIAAMVMLKAGIIRVVSEHIAAPNRQQSSSFA
jgi:hypothetical protein